MTTTSTNQDRQTEEIARLNQLFAQRYTDADEEYVDMKSKNYDPPVVPDWEDLPAPRPRGAPNHYGQNRGNRGNYSERYRPFDDRNRNRNRDRSRSPHRYEQRDQSHSHRRHHSNDYRYNGNHRDRYDRNDRYYNRR